MPTRQFQPSGERKWTMRIVWKTTGLVQWVAFQDREWIDREIRERWAEWSAERLGESFVRRVGPHSIQPVSCTEEEFFRTYAEDRRGFRPAESARFQEEFEE